jgi:hypothetical protein
MVAFAIEGREVNIFTSTKRAFTLHHRTYRSPKRCSADSSRLIKISDFLIVDYTKLATYEAI